ncbi:MAG TPA: DUF6398 domain-containing protein [Ktedonobacteraceae bacterium]|nr:DUF6398 domain-containing protein [Ktedonobacteraceae bacterium]
MPKRSASQHVSKEMQARFEEITHLTDAFCSKYLNEEYRQLCRELTATLGRKRPSPLLQGKAPTWACGIIHALGMVNFLFDSSQTPPYIKAKVQLTQERQRKLTHPLTGPILCVFQTPGGTNDKEWYHQYDT